MRHIRNFLIIVFCASIVFQQTSIAHTHEIRANIYLMFEDEICPGPDFFDKQSCKKFPPSISKNFLEQVESQLSLVTELPFSGKLSFELDSELAPLRKLIFRNHIDVTRLERENKNLNRMLAVFLSIKSLSGPLTAKQLTRHTDLFGKVSEKIWDMQEADTIYVTYMDARMVHPEVLEKFIVQFQDGHEHEVTFK